MIIDIILVNIIMKKHPDIIILEGIWNDDISKNSSVRAFIEALANELELNISYRSYHDSKDLEHWISIFAKTKNSRICYIAGHGVKNAKSSRLKSEIGSDINLKFLLSKVFPIDKKVLYGKKGILIGSCLVGNTANLNAIIESTGNSLSWVAGYGTTIPWFESTLTDMLFLKYYFNGRCNYSEDYDFTEQKMLTPDEVIESVLTDFPYIKDYKFNLVSK